MMRASGRFGTYMVLGFVAMLGLAACGDDKKDSTTATTTGGPQTINGCVIQPGTSCPGANLPGQNLQGVNLTGANLATANLSKANLSNANLSGANLTSANLTGVTMQNTNLSGANLTNADFAGGNLSNVNLTNAVHCGTIRTDGSIDNASCPQAPPTTKSPPTTTAVTLPACDKSTLSSALKSNGYPDLTIETVTCGGKYAAVVINTVPEQVALFKIGADADSWHLVNAPYPIGGTPPNVAALCSSLTPEVAGVVGCGSG